MAQNIFQQNVSNLYGAQQQQEYDQLKKLQQERKRTQGLENLYRIMMGQAPTFGGSGASTLSVEEGPSRAEIETEQLHKKIQQQGITSQQGVSELLSGSEASFEASDAIRKNMPLYDLGDPVTLYQVAEGRVSPLEQTFQSKDIAGIEGAISQGAFRDKEDAEAFALNENLLRVEADLRELAIKTNGDINEEDIEKLIINKPDYETNPFLMTALKSVTSGMDLDVKIFVLNLLSLIVILMRFYFLTKQEKIILIILQIYMLILNKLLKEQIYLLVKILLKLLLQIQKKIQLP